MPVNSWLVATKIVGQREAFYRHRIPQSSCARKETVAIDILVTSRNVDRKTMQSIRVTSRPSSKKGEWNHVRHFWRTSTKLTPIEAVLAIEIEWEPQSNLEEKVNPSILKDDFSSRTDPFIFTSIEPVL